VDAPGVAPLSLALDLQETLLDMRAFICTNLGKKLYKIVWINEDSAGVYVGLYGKEGGTHFSYHVDGTKHFKRASDMKTPLLQSQRGKMHS
jgi:hypothetical protein